MCGGCSPSWVYFSPSLPSRCEWRPLSSCPVLCCPAEPTPGTECADLAPGPHQRAAKWAAGLSRGPRAQAKGPGEAPALPWCHIPWRRTPQFPEHQEGRDAVASGATPETLWGSLLMQLRVGTGHHRLPKLCLPLSSLCWSPGNPTQTNTQKRKACQRTGGSE